MLKFIYKNIEYTWDEWNSEKREFINQLELPDDFFINWQKRDLSIAYDMGYSIAMDKFRELYRLIASARNSLINSFDKFYESNIIEWGSNYISHMWMRGEFLKNSIIWYNSCEDYIYQILWFAFDMGKQDIKSSKEYQEQLKQVCYKNIKKKLNTIGTKESNELLSFIDKYRFDSDVKYMRDSLANNLKHRASLAFDGFEDNRMMKFEKRNSDGDLVFSSRFIEPEIVCIDETIDKLKDIHKKIVEFGRDVQKFINFDEMFEKTEEGVISANIIKDKKLYKKIIL